MISCEDVLAGISKVGNSTADIVIVDPPYNIGKDFGTTKDSMSLKDYLLWADEWVSECERVLKDTGTLYIYGFDEILCHIASDLPYPLDHRWLIWHYTNKNNPHLQFWQRSHESILCCWKYEKMRIFNLDEVREPYTDAFLKNAAGKPRKGTKGRFSHGKESVYTANELGALPRDVLYCAALAGGAGLTERRFLCKTCDNVYTNKSLKEHEGHDIVQHPTQKPLELTRRLLKAAKPKEGGLAIVPFVGSGTECYVAKELDMEYVGWDNNEDYVKLATKFVNETKSQ